jgi:maltokinase
MSPDIPWEELSRLLPTWLADQRWFAKEAAPRELRLVGWEPLGLGEETPAWWLVIGAGEDLYQLVLAAKRTNDAPPKTKHLVGVITPSREHRQHGSLACFDALGEAPFALALLEVSLGIRAKRCRPLGLEQSNTSLVFDEAVMFKLYRRVATGPNPEVEMVMALDREGFNHVPAPLGVWRNERFGIDCAIAEEYLACGSDGWSSALGSLRDLLALAQAAEEQGQPGLDRMVQSAGADFSSEADRLGVTVARMHAALRRALGEEPASGSDLAGELASAVSVLRRDERASGYLDGPAWVALERLVEQAAQVKDAGSAIRLHGDLHLGQVLRVAFGWYVLDFEGEPLRPLQERRRRASPLMDVAGMLRSFDYASAAARLERGGVGLDDEGLRAVGEAWARRNRQSFLAGYLREAPPDMLPRPSDLAVLLAAAEARKACYELTYEVRHRPGWALCPQEGLLRLLSAKDPSEMYR